MPEEETVGAQQTRVGHTKADETDAYAGRGYAGKNIHTAEVGERGWLGNPYTVEEYSREEAIEKFREDFEERLADDATFRSEVQQLAGCTLGCWCQQLDDDGPACHAEVIAEHADRLARGGSGGE